MSCFRWDGESNADAGAAPLARDTPHRRQSLVPWEIKLAANL